MKKMIIGIWLLFLLFGSESVFAVWDGTDSEEVTPFEDVYYIRTAGQLMWLSDEVANGNSFKDRTVILTGNIDLGMQEWAPIGTEDNPFMGNFYGNRYTISNLNLDGTGDYNGLFGLVRADENTSITIKDVKIENASKTTSQGRPTGALIGEVWNSPGGKITISGCYVTGKLRGNIVGGAVGQIRSGHRNSTVSIKDIRSTVEIETEACGGGIMAQVDMGDYNREEGSDVKVIVEDCQYQGNISSKGRWGTGGGIIGRYVNSNPDITMLIKHCRVEGEVNAGSAAFGGGIISTIPAGLKVISCVSYTDVYGYNSGCITSSNDGIIEECFTNGNAKAMLGGENGGITAYNNGRIFNSYNEGRAQTSSALSYNGNIAASGSGTVENTYNIGPHEWEINTSVAQSHPGIFGYSSGQTLINSYYDNTLGGYLFGNIRETTIINDASNNIYASGGMSTDLMKTRWSYSGWDFNNVWEFDPEYSRGYPTLRSIKDLLKKDQDAFYIPDPYDPTENVYPIILVEGYMGSNLYTELNDGEGHQVWAAKKDGLKVTPLFWSALGKVRMDTILFPHYNHLNLQMVGNLSDYDLEAEGKSDETGEAGTFGGLINDIRNRFPYRQIYLFSYDFRQSNEVSAENLIEQINWVIDRSGKDKVDIVAHSNGGLVLSRAAKKLNDDGKINIIDKIITCGTPYEGTTVLLDRSMTDRVLHTVEEKDIFDSLLALLGLSSETKREFDSITQLVPTKDLFNDKVTNDNENNPTLTKNVKWAFSKQVEKEFPREKNCSKYNQYCTTVKYKNLFISNMLDLTWDEYKNIIRTVYGADNYEAAQTFHDNLKENDVNILATLDNSYFIIGNGKYTVKDAVFSQVKYKKEYKILKNWYEYNKDFDANRNDLDRKWEFGNIYDVYSGNGKVITNDISAYKILTERWEAISKQAEEYILADVNYTKKGDGTVPYYSGTMAGNINFNLPLDKDGRNRFIVLDADHGGTVKNRNARDMILSILSNGKTKNNADPSNSEGFIKVLIDCPVEVRIEHDGDVLDSSVENMSVQSIFGRLDYAGLEGDIKVLCLDKDLYQIQMQGTNEGEMDLSLEWYDENENLVIEKQFLQIPIYNTAKLSLETNEEGITILNVDNDGDGTIDEKWYSNNGEVGYQIEWEPEEPTDPEEPEEPVEPEEPEEPVEPEEPEEPFDPEEPEEPLPEPNRQSLSFFRLDTDVLPRTGFSAIHPQVLSSQPKNVNYKPLQMTLEIPGISVESKILEVPYVDNDYAVTWLSDAVGLLEGSSIPGKGTTVLVAHNHLNNTESGPFALLSTLEEGERVFVRDKRNNLQTFVVFANEKLAETDISSFARITEAFDNVLVMITCEDERPEGGYVNRRIVVARLQDK